MHVRNMHRIVWITTCIQSVITIYKVRSVCIQYGFTVQQLLFALGLGAVPVDEPTPHGELVEQHAVVPDPAVGRKLPRGVPVMYQCMSFNYYFTTLTVTCI